MLTIDTLVDRIQPYVNRAIDLELLPGTRWAAKKIARWKIRKTIEAMVALHGHQVSPVLGDLQPIGERLFKVEVCTAMEDAKSICDTPVSMFGQWAVDARRDAGPALLPKR